MIITEGVKLRDENGNSYILEKNIKDGGFGKVFIARRLSDNNIFAVKTILNSFPNEKDYFAFKNEIASALQISSPYVIKYEFAHDGSMFSDLPPYIIMEYASNGNLSEVINERIKNKDFFSKEELLSIFSRLALGMKDINNYIVHRDIKTANILVADDGLKICDFGLAKLADDNTRTMTFKGFGTVKYIAPEAWRNEENTIQMDIYSMGIVFYELSTLAYPYEIKEPNNFESYKEAHLYQPVINPKKYNLQLPIAIVSLIIKMLEKPKAKRFDKWDDIIDLLNSINNSIVEPSKVSSFVDMAIGKQLEKDIELKKQQSIQEQKINKTMAFCKQVYSQYIIDIYNPIKEFIEEFNMQSANGKIQIDATITNGLSGSHFKNKLTLPGNITITIEMQILFDEFRRDVNGPLGQYTEKYFPKCNNKRIIAWGLIKEQNKTGYNVLLLENEIDDYGEWWELHNTNNPLSRQRRIEPFGFELDELPREIELINAMHIYNSAVEKFEIEQVYSFICSCISI